MRSSRPRPRPAADSIDTAGRHDRKTSRFACRHRQPGKTSRRSEPVAARGGPTGLQHRSDQLATPCVVESFGWHTSRPPLGFAPRRFSCLPDGLTSRPAARDVFPVVSVMGRDARLDRRHPPVRSTAILPTVYPQPRLRRQLRRPRSSNRDWWIPPQGKTAADPR